MLASRVSASPSKSPLTLSVICASVRLSALSHWPIRQNVAARMSRISAAYRPFGNSPVILSDACITRWDRTAPPDALSGQLRYNLVGRSALQERRHRGCAGTRRISRARQTNIAASRFWLCGYFARKSRPFLQLWKITRMICGPVGFFASGMSVFTSIRLPATRPIRQNRDNRENLGAPGFSAASISASTASSLSCTEIPGSAGESGQCVRCNGVEAN